jgi:hypothetical protein
MAVRLRDGDGSLKIAQPEHTTGISLKFKICIKVLAIAIR